MPLIAYSSPFVPPEWIVAHGLTPCRLTPGASDHRATVTGTCPYAMAFLSAAQAAGADGAVFCTTCDQMRRMPEQLREGATPRPFLLNVAHTWQTPAALSLYRDELGRLGRFLVRLGGVPPSDARLADVMANYEARRRSLRARLGVLGGRAAAEAMIRFHRAGAIANPAPCPPVAGIPIALLGGPLPAEALGLLDLVEARGGTVVLDGTEGGERGLPPPFDQRRLREAPFAELAATYFTGIPDIFQRPNSRLFTWLKKEIVRSGARGIVLVRHLWCDLWHAEAARLREWLALPFADILLDGTPPSAHAASRLEALLEALR
ncbi:MAG: 2-hydroxyacyl-CoA dehydratase [Kiritimatiellae bacterium]|nr:2-hydroxyacyl-CoA dehydratase [Kiritimatiellia bacterium]